MTRSLWLCGVAALVAAAGCSFPDHQFLPVDQFNQLKDSGTSGGSAGTGGSVTGGSGGTSGSAGGGGVDAGGSGGVDGGGPGGTAGTGGGGGIAGSGGAGGVDGGGAGGAAGSGGTGGADAGGSGGAAGTGGSGGIPGSGGVDGGGAGGTAGSGGAGGSDGGFCSGPVVINEVSTDGATASDEFVELYNEGSCTVSLFNWTLHYSPQSGSTTYKYWTGGAGDSLPAGGYYVLAGAGFQGTSDGALSTKGMNQAAGGVGLYNNFNTLVDAMAWGPVAAGHPYVESTPCGVIPTSESAARTPNGIDTDDNSKDFAVGVPRTPGAKN